MELSFAVFMGGYFATLPFSLIEMDKRNWDSGLAGAIVVSMLWPVSLPVLLFLLIRDARAT